MADGINAILARPVPVVAGLMALGAVLGYVELGTMAALAFMAAGLVMMFVYGRQG
jgi:hypothetical protein